MRRERTRISECAGNMRIWCGFEGLVELVEADGEGGYFECIKRVIMRCVETKRIAERTKWTAEGDRQVGWCGVDCGVRVGSI